MNEPNGLDGRLQRPRDALKTHFLAAGRAVCVGLLAGMPAGVLVGGFGSRIVMRISALVGGEEIAGRLTENGNVVGEITGQGTLELVIFAGLAPGILGGLLYGIIRAWLPGRSFARGLLFGVLLLAVFGAGIINSGNRDFVELGSPGLNVTMFALLFVLFGVATATAATWLDGCLPRVIELRRRRYWYPYAVAPAVLLLPLLGGGVVGIFVAVPVVAVGVVLYAMAGIWYSPATRFVSLLLGFPAVRQGARLLAFGVPAGIGGVFLVRSVLAILG
jgi:hypothetical protein